MGQSIINNPETLATLGKKKQEEDKKKNKKTKKKTTHTI